MGKSARVLGWEFGVTAREMNALLKAHGYLDGEPGAYRLTEKGEQYGEEQYHDNGYGGYAHRNWETRTWREDLADALRADIEAHPDGLPPQPLESETEIDAPEHRVDLDLAEGERDSGFNLSGKQLVGAVGIIAGVAAAVVVAPHVKPFWDNKVKPTARKVRQRLSRREPEVGECTPAVHDGTD